MSDSPVVSPDDKKSKRKALVAEKEQRINLIYQLLLQGYPREVIFQNVSSWQLSVRMIQHYIRWATERIHAVAAAAQDDAVLQMLARHADLRAKMYAAAGYADVLKVDQEDAKLMGLYPTEKSVNLEIDWNSLPTLAVERIAAGEDILKVLAEVKSAERVPGVVTE
jgi:hypothetical protein